MYCNSVPVISNFKMLINTSDVITRQKPHWHFPAYHQAKRDPCKPFMLYPRARPFKRLHPFIIL